MTFFTRIALTLICLGWISCTGSIGQKGFVDRDSVEPGKFTYQGLLREAQMNNLGQYILEGAETTTTTQTTTTLFTTTQDLKINTVSVNHAGDLDFAIEAMTLQNFDLIATLEIPGGPVIGVVNLTDLGVVTQQQLNRVSVTNTTNLEVDIKVNSNVVKEGESFAVNLFTCLDSNNNDKCSDELVDNMVNIPDNLDANPNIPFKVVYFEALKGVITTEDSKAKLDLTRDTINELNTPNGVMRDVLKNLPPPNKDDAFSLNLAIGSDNLGNDVPDQTMPTKGEGPPGVDTPKTHSAKDLATKRKAEKKAQEQNANTRQNQDIGQKQNPNMPIMPRIPPRRMMRTNGCFIEGTHIYIGHGRSVLVENIGIGFGVVNMANKHLTVKNAVVGPEKHPIIQISTQGGHKIGVTRTHPMWTPSGLKMAKDLNKGDLLMTAKGAPVAITSLRRVPYSGQVYNIALPGTGTRNHLIIADGLVTGDLYLQQKLSTKK
jgi:hypothetical protein